MEGILGKEERVYIHSGVPILVGNSSKLCQLCAKRLSLCGFCGVGGKLSLISLIKEIILLRSAYGTSGGWLKN